MRFETRSMSQVVVTPAPRAVMAVTAPQRCHIENVPTLMESYDLMPAMEQATTPELERADANLLNLLIVDDERAIRDGCREVAQQIGFQTYIADNAEHAFRVLDNTSVDVVLLDLRMPGLGGLEVLHEVKRRRPETVVIVITGYATVQSAVQAMKHGAYDYVTKPFNMEELRLLLERVTSHLQLTSENRILREQVKSKEGFGSIIGRAPEMEKLYRIITKAAHSTHPVLILGESGTGKELVARSIHFSGPFRENPFVAVDCGSLVPTLIESELFGYVKGAFTGATKSKEGLLATAEGGTIFLDEIGELPIDLQSKLLRALQEKEIRPVGGTRPVPINVRILAATNRDLEQAVATGTFRRDLYFRLNVLSLRIPPLRQRKQDIPLLVGHFLERLARSTGVQRNISDEALKLMLTYEWPGNIRELENCIERACALTSGPTIHLGDLPTSIQTWRQQTQAAVEATTAPTVRSIMPICEMEKQAILGAIEQLHGDKLEAARLLGIGKTTLYRKLKEYGALQ
jgi:DNA-binding NtrC family response regulator